MADKSLKQKKQESAELTQITGSSSSHLDLSAQNASHEISALKEHIPFYSVDLSVYSDTSAMIVHFALKGSPAQKSAIARTFGLKSSFAAPEIRSTNREKTLAAVNYIESEIVNLAKEFGVNYSGDAGSMATDIVMEYGGMTYLDCIKFFHSAKTGKYKTEMQHVSARGITREFLQDWLSKYLDEKEDARLSLNNDLQQTKEIPNWTIKDTKIIQDYRKELADRKELELKVESMQDPKSDTILIDAIFSLVESPGRDYKSFIEKCELEIQSKCEKALGFIDESQEQKEASKFITQQKKSLQYKIKKTFRDTTAERLCWKIISAKANTSKELNELLNFEDLPDAPILQLHAARITERIANHYSKSWYKYAERLIASNKVPHPKKNWVKNMCRWWYIEQLGPEGDLFYLMLNDEF